MTDKNELLNTELGTAAVAMHELFTTLIAAGFARREALAIVTDILKAMAIEGIQQATRDQN